MSALDVVCTGELVIDFVPKRRGITLAEAETFVRVPGGAPGNVAVGLARLGRRSAFLGKVGDDPFGHLLAATLEGNGVETQGIRFAGEARTALAFVSLTPEGDRDFSFYRHPSADMLYAPEEVDARVIARASALHFGSVSLIAEPSRSATLHAIALAKAAGLTITCDPNLRLPLWPDAGAARRGIRDALPLADIVKMSAEELAFLAGTHDRAAGVRALWREGLALLAITDGAAGSSYYTPRFRGDVPAITVEVVDTTGAGDAFMAALLDGALDPAVLGDEPALAQLFRRANAAGALCTRTRGAIPGMPTHAQITDSLAAAV